MIRLSGPKSLAIIRSFVRDDEFSPEPNLVTLKTIFEAESGEIWTRHWSAISKLLTPSAARRWWRLVVMARRSFLPTADQILKLDGRLAGPGEFTLRACRNGKMNLSQAEAIRDLSEAKTKLAAQLATHQMKGELWRRWK